MDERLLKNTLNDLQIPDIYFYPETDSTNERALVLAAKGAPEFTLVIAERQTAGRGRFGRRWETAPGTSLAFTKKLRLGGICSFFGQPGLSSGHC